ncbi:MAG: efflux RND transporter periplasmic adaptor subunit [Endozoicomonas sp.]
MRTHSYPGRILLLTLVLLFSSLTMAASRGSAAQIVEIEPVTVLSRSDQLMALGTVSAREQIVVTSKVDGFIEQLNIADGQPVQAGQSLIELDSRFEQAKLAEAEAQLKEDQRRLQELQQLVARKAVSASELAAQEAIVAQSEAQLQAVSATLSFYSLQAPFSGVLGLSQLSPGQYIRPGDELVSLTNLDNLYVDFSVPSRHLSRIQRGMDLTMIFEAMPGRTFLASVANVDALVSTESRNLTVRANLDNEGQFLRPGLLARVQLDFSAREVMAIKTSSIFYRGSQAYVYTVNAGGQAVERAVTGTVDGETTVITAGLSVGDNVVTVGVGKIGNGVRVQSARSVASSADQDNREGLL